MKTSSDLHNNYIPIPSSPLPIPIPISHLLIPALIMVPLSYIFSLLLPLAFCYIPTSIYPDYPPTS